MPVIFYRKHRKVKNRWNSHISLLHLAALGNSLEAADESLKQMLNSLLAPFQRSGTLDKEMRALGIGPVEGDVLVVLRLFSRSLF